MEEKETSDLQEALFQNFSKNLDTLLCKLDPLNHVSDIYYSDVPYHALVHIKDSISSRLIDGKEFLDFVRGTKPFCVDSSRIVSKEYYFNNNAVWEEDLCKVKRVLFRRTKKPIKVRLCFYSTPEVRNYTEIMHEIKPRLGKRLGLT